MNIASGCPRFISHTDLKSYIFDDTIFIKCSVDTNTQVYSFVILFCFFVCFGGVVCLFVLY